MATIDMPTNEEIDRLSTHSRILYRQVRDALRAQEEASLEIVAQVQRVADGIDEFRRKTEARQIGFIKVWRWLRASIMHAAGTAKDIHIDSVDPGV